MSMVIASTTDSQQAVDSAAGIGTGPENPPEAPQETAVPESAGAPGAPDDESLPAEETQDETEQQQQRKLSAERRIGQLTREKHMLAGQLEELRRSLRPPEPPPQPQQPRQQMPPARPRAEEFQSDAEYIEALTDWKSAQVYYQLRSDMERQHAQQEQARQVADWKARVQAVRKEEPDFDQVVLANSDVRLHPKLQEALMRHPQGERLAWELAKDRGELEQIAAMEPEQALVALGRFESRMQQAREKPPLTPSRAPAPIVPLGGSSARTSTPLDQLPYQEYRKIRNMQEARARQRGR